MDDHTKLELLEYWLDNPAQRMKLPEKLKSKVKEEDIKNLILEIKCNKNYKGGSILNSNVIFEHAAKIRQKIKEKLEIEFIKSGKIISKKQIKLQEDFNKKQGEIVLLTKQQSETSKKQKNVIWWQIGVTSFITLILIWVTFHIGDQANNISATQTEILRISSPPYEPDIDMNLDGDLNISTSELTNCNECVGEDSHYRSPKIAVAIYNFGMSNATINSCKIKLSNENLSGYLEPSNIEVPTLKLNYMYLHLYYKDRCYGNCDNPNLVNTGIYNLTLDCKCIGCKTKERFTKSFKFCIYSKNKIECQI